LRGIARISDHAGSSLGSRTTTPRPFSMPAALAPTLALGASRRGCTRVASSPVTTCATDCFITNRTRPLLSGALLD
jgi:hypothetical protein